MVFFCAFVLVWCPVEVECCVGGFGFDVFVAACELGGVIEGSDERDPQACRDPDRGVRPVLAVAAPERAAPVDEGPDPVAAVRRGLTHRADDGGLPWPAWVTAV